MAISPKGKRGAPRKLTTEQQHFIVNRLACYTSIIDTQKEFEAEYGEPIDRNLVGRYDPTRRYTAKLGQRLVELFYATRKNYEDGLLAMHPISKKVYRVDQLGRMFERAYDKGNHPFAAQLLKQAAEEVAQLDDRKAKDRRWGRDTQAAEAEDDNGDSVEVEVELDNMRAVLADTLSGILAAAQNSTKQ